MSPAFPPCFSVLDVFDGLFTLRKRSPTLDGAVPLRAAQACLPLLAGNALGFQVVLSRPLPLRRRLGGYALQDETSRPAAPSPLLALQQAALSRLVQHGQVQPAGPWQKTLQQGLLWSTRSLVGRRADRLWIWTGLLLKPDPGVWLRVLGAANRRHIGIAVAEVVVADDGVFVPLVLELTLGPGAPRELELHGELACLVPFSPAVTFASAQLESESAVGQAHANFYDASYFAQKKKGTTRRYRRQIDTRSEAPAADDPATGDPADDPATGDPAACPVAGKLAAASAPGPLTQLAAACQVIAAGPGTFTIQSCQRFASAVEPVPGPRPSEARRAQGVQFYNLLPFSCFYDGYSLRLKYSATELKAKSQQLWQRWRALYGQAFVEAHKGALWYLSRYFTSHPPGEPYFFVKPWAFVRTPPGWSCLVEGAHGDGYDVLRGVVATDQFFATPGVFFLHGVNREVAVAADAPLVRALPIPRRLLHAGYRTADLGSKA